MDLRSTFMPMTVVEQADELMQQARILMGNHQSMMGNGDRVLAEDQMRW